MATIWQFYRGVLWGVLLLLVGFYAVSIFVPDGRVGARLADLPCGQPTQPCVLGQRSYHVAIPEGSGPFPVVLFFHGSGQTGAAAVGNGAIAGRMAARGYAVVAPDALDITYQGGGQRSGWIFQGQRDGRDDHAFVREVLGDVSRRFGLDTNTVLLTGHSNGATFAWYLACSGHDIRFRAVAPVGGAMVRDTPWRCDRSTHRFHLLHTHGRRDAVYPLAGTGPDGAWNGWLAPEASVAFLAEKARCQTREATWTGRVERISWQGCQRGLNLSLAIYPTGHEIPGPWADMALDWYEALPGTDVR